MTTVTEFVTKKSYSLNHNLDDEQDCIESVMEKSGYICDAISETADNYIPIYTSDIWENASKIRDSIEDAIAEGIAPVEGRDVDLEKIFQSGYYVYYERLIYENLDEIAFNYIADKVNEAVSELSTETQQAIDFDTVSDDIEGETTNFDNNNTFDDLEDIAQTIITNINEGQYVA